MERMTAETAYAELIQRSREEALLESCQALLGWDELTFMPPGGVAARANQLAYLAGLHHARATDPRIGDLLAAVESTPLVSDPRSAVAVNVREIRRAFNRQVRLPRTLVEEMARVAPLAQQQWATARQEADFAAFCPWLEKIIALQRQEAACLGYADSPYDALLDNYEPGTRSADIARLFEALRTELTPLMVAIAGSRKRRKQSILRRNYPVERQHAFAMEAAVAVGFDFERGRVDTSVHPFSTHIAHGDCRIAIRYSANYFSDAFFALLHEVGHGLYEQGLDPEHEGTPMGAVLSVALHESQSRLWENLVGRSLPFWKYFYPRARQAFPEALGKVALSDFHLAINHVEPSLNRVQADEVTYNMHILVRFELERALIGGDLPVTDLPGAWNEAYQKTLGVTVPNDAEGCLQDGHWSEGLIGYFPTYTLGNVCAAQLFARARAELGNLDAAFARGDFSTLLGWLRARVHREGGRYAAPALIEKVTGQPPDHRPLVTMLRDKYSEVYGI